MVSQLVVRAIPPFLPSAGTQEAGREVGRDAGRNLDIAELSRAAAMEPGARAGFLAGRLAQRLFAADLLDVSAGQLTAAYSCPRCGTGPEVSHGRPGYSLAGRPAPLALSISRAAGWALLAAVVDPPRGVRLGVDVEEPSRTGFDGFSALALTESEQRGTRHLRGQELLAAQARLWARKEAWLKMTGEGLRTAPCSVAALELPGVRDLDPAETGLPAGLAAAVAMAGAVA